MDTIEIQLLNLHQLDITNNIVEKIDLDIKKDTIIKYVKNLIDEVLESPNKRLYKFKSGNTEIKNSIPKISNNTKGINKILFNNASRLLEKEINIDNKIKKLGVRVQRGSLLQIHFKQNGNDNVLMCKVEHDEIINEKNFELNSGLNTKRKVFKSFLNYLPSKGRNEEVYVNDKHNSKYWWSEFLELEQVNSDEANTEKSLEKIIRIIDKEKNKVKFSLDGTLLRNSVVGYFKTNKEFNFSDLYGVITKYSPFNSEFPMENITSKLNKLEGDTSFDKQFSIVQNKIDKRIVNNIPLGKGLYLKINKHVPNLSEIIKPYNGIDGKTGMTIISDQAYNFIKKMSI